MDKAHPSSPEPTPEASAEPSTFDRAFEDYFLRQSVLDEEFGHQRYKLEHIQGLINDLVSQLLSQGGVYFFIDGLDETTSGISHVLEFLNSLCKKWATQEVRC